MQKGTLTIITEIDGKKTQVEYAAQICLQGQAVTLVYTDNESTVRIAYDNGLLQIARQGGYQMQLTLRQGEITAGSLGIGAQSGEVAVHTQKLTSKIKADGWLCTAKYALIIGGQPQVTSVRMYAAVKE